MLAGPHPRSLLPRASALGSGRRRLPAAPLSTAEIGGGSSFKIAPIKLAWLFPSNAFFAREHLVQDPAEGEDVRARVGIEALNWLRRHVLEGAVPAAVRFGSAVGAELRT